MCAVVSRQFYCTISSEGLFFFAAIKTPYLCGFWRFTNAYKKIKVGGEFENSLVSFIESNGYENENYMISPTSYRAAIVLATAGADAQTKDKLLKAIGFKDMDEANNWYNRVLSSSFAYKKNADGSFEFDESNDSNKIVINLFLLSHISPVKAEINSS